MGSIEPAGSPLEVIDSKCSMEPEVSYRLRQYYLENFGPDSASIPEGAELESSREPAVIRKWGLKPDGYF